MRIVQCGDKFRFEVRNRQDAEDAVAIMESNGADKVAFFHLGQTNTVCKCPIGECGKAIVSIFSTPQSDIAIRPAARLS